MTEEEATIIVAPVNVFLPPAVQAVQGSIQITAACGHLCWLSPQGQKFMAKDKAYVTKCVDCAKDLIDDPEQHHLAVPGARAALRESHGWAAEQEAWQALSKRLGGPVEEAPEDP